MLRSSILPLRAFTAVAFLLGGVASAACGDSATSAFGAGDESPTLEDQSVDAAQRTSLAEDAGAIAPEPFRGNPLCQALATTCMPDDTADEPTAGSIVCAPAPDGGADAGASESTVGCRIARGKDSVVAPACLGAAADGVDGTACTSGSDCAPGFDCVVGEKGSSCRRYCCLGSCRGQTSQNGGDTFCDVQKLVEANHRAPVCMPLKRCKLLSPGECSANETCAVVDEDGETGCVGIGPAQVGQACDATHCASGLTCLGQAGNRKCYQLCKVSASACGSSQVCKTSAVFKDMSFGICQTP